MADKKISALTSATTPLAGTEVLPIVQSGATVKVPVSDLTSGRVVAAEGIAVGGGSFASWSLYKAAQVGPTGVFSNVSGTTRLGDNFYYDGSNYRYLTSSFVSMMQFNGGAGGFTFFGAPSGTAGNTVSFTQYLDMSATGNMTLNTGNLVAGTAGKGVTGAGGLFLQTFAVVAAGGTLDLTINTAGFVGTLSISNTRDNFPAQSRRQVTAVACYGTTFTSTNLHTQDGTGGGPAYTITVPSAGTLRYTDTSGDGSSKSVYLTFSGSRSAG